MILQFNALRLRSQIGLLLTLLMVVGSVASCRTTPVKSSQPLAILQGPTSESQTRFAVLRKAHQDVRYEVDGESGSVVRHSHPDSSWVVDHVSFDDLKINRRYQLLVQVAGKLIDQREFSTLGLQKSQLSFAVASCMDDRRPVSEFEMWEQLNSHKPDIIFLIGDTVYATKGIDASSPQPRHLWMRYVQTRQALPIFYQKKLTPILATWDDHDYGQNNGDQTYKFKNEAKEIFRQFFPQQDMGRSYETGPGVATAFRGFQQQFLLLDDRSFRTPNNEALSSQTHWGAQQEQWIVQHLSKGEPTWLMNGDQLFGGYHKFESYEGNHPLSFKTMMKQIGLQKSPVAFVTGDRHLAELMHVQPPEFAYPTFELTTSGLHARTYPSRWDKSPNPRQVKGAAHELNFAIIKSAVSSKTWNVHLSVYGRRSQELFSEEFSLPLVNTR